MLTSNSPQILAFIDAANAAYARYWSDNKITYAQCPKIVATDRQKFIYLQVHEERGGVYTPGTVYAFIVKEAHTTRTLGELKEGDILKAATWKAPAKHARGNVFSPTNGAEAISAGGSSIRYLQQ